jgi:bifunctional non-homologous end joining protein LigD
MDEADDPLVFRHACKLGLEGIVSKRKDSRYRSGRSPDRIRARTRPRRRGFDPSLPFDDKFCCDA